MVFCYWQHNMPCTIPPNIHGDEIIPLTKVRKQLSLVVWIFFFRSHTSRQLPSSSREMVAFIMLSFESVVLLLPLILRLFTSRNYSHFLRLIRFYQLQYFLILTPPKMLLSSLRLFLPYSFLRPKRMILWLEALQGSLIPSPSCVDALIRPIAYFATRDSSGQFCCQYLDYFPGCFPFHPLFSSLLLQQVYLVAEGLVLRLNDSVSSPHGLCPVEFAASSDFSVVSDRPCFQSYFCNHRSILVL